MTRPRHFLHPLTLLLVASLPGATTIGAQQLSRADSTLVARILMAEDRRDTTDAALAEGRAHPDVRVRMLAERAVA
ncbi:MAG: hypothetical protein ACKN99_02880, partial [Gemmatimonadota bacterium]